MHYNVLHRCKNFFWGGGGSTPCNCNFTNFGFYNWNCIKISKHMYFLPGGRWGGYLCLLILYIQITYVPCSIQRNVKLCLLFQISWATEGWCYCDLWRTWGQRVCLMLVHSRPLGLRLPQLWWSSCDKQSSSCRKIQNSFMMSISPTEHYWNTE